MKAGEVWAFKCQHYFEFELFRVIIKRFDDQYVYVGLYDYTYDRNLDEEQLEYAMKVMAWEGWETEQIHSIPLDYFLRMYQKDYSVEKKWAGRT